MRAGARAWLLSAGGDRILACASLPGFGWKAEAESSLVNPCLHHPSLLTDGGAVRLGGPHEPQDGESLPPPPLPTRR
jgi:hypothetical protein